MENHHQQPDEPAAVAVPVGYRFDPSDQQLLTSYLKPKLKREAVPVLPESRTCPLMMKEIELYGDAGTEPWNLFARYARPNKKFYVFCKLGKKSESGSGKKLNRVAGCGTWDLQSTNLVFHGGRQLGRKRLFRFELRDKVKSETDFMKCPRWIMHEYTLDGFPSYALCEIQNMVSAKDLAESSSGEDDEDLDLDLDEYLNGGQKRKRSDDYSNINSISNNTNPAESVPPPVSSQPIIPSHMNHNIHNDEQQLVNHQVVDNNLQVRRVKPCYSTRMYVLAPRPS